MEQRLRQRLVGAAVLAGLAVIFLPMLLNDTAVEEPRIETTNIPPKPAGEEFTSRVIPLDTQPAPVTPADTAPPAQAAEEPPAAEGTESDVAATGTGAGPSEPAPRTGVTAWVVQLGSFASEQNAKDLERRLQKEGYSAFVEKLYLAEGSKYRVRVGPELVRAKADVARDKLEKDLNLKGIVVRYP